MTRRDGSGRVRAGGRTRARRALVVGLVAAGLLVGDPLTAALASPTPTPSPVTTPPSAADVANARKAVKEAASSVAEIEVRLAELSAAADEAGVAAQHAGEEYTQALAAADEARAAAEAARDRSADADADAEDARRELMAFARQLARSGGSIETIEALLSSDGFVDVAERTAALDRLTGKADETVQNFRAAQLVADTMRAHAEQAEATAATAEAAAQAALAAAEAAQNAAEDQVAAASVARDGLILKLAEARQTSADVERARQDELDRQRREREEAAAQAARLAAAPPAAPEVVTPAVNEAPATPAASAAPPPAPAAPTTAPATPAAPPGDPLVPGYTGGWSDGVVEIPASQYPLGSGRSVGTAEQGIAAVEWAKTQLGKSYGWGASGPDTFDCSGLTMRAWEAAGVNITRTSRDQYMRVLKIDYQDLRPGDLVFWTDDPNDVDEIYHVAMWLGPMEVDGQVKAMILEAPSYSNPVRITEMRWAKTMPYAGRP